jgi:hypothetical protein
MVVQPLVYGRRIAVGQKVDDIAPFQVHNDRAVASPLATRPVVDTDKSRWRRGLNLELLYAEEESVSASRDGQANGQTGAGLTANSRADCFMGFAESIGCAAVWTSKSPQALGKDPSRILGLRAKEPSNRDHEPNGFAKARQVSKGAVVAAVNPVGLRATDRASRSRSGGL